MPLAAAFFSTGFGLCSLLVALIYFGYKAFRQDKSHSEAAPNRSTADSAVIARIKAARTPGELVAATLSAGRRLVGKENDAVLEKMQDVGTLSCRQAYAIFFVAEGGSKLAAIVLGKLSAYYSKHSPKFLPGDLGSNPS